MAVAGYMAEYMDGSRTGDWSPSVSGYMAEYMDGSRTGGLRGCADLVPERLGIYGRVYGRESHGWFTRLR